MLSEPRAILFQTELEWPPAEVHDFRIDKEIVRKFYNELFEYKSGEHCYENLDLQAVKPTLSTRIATRQSVCQFGDGSINIEEQRPDFALGGFTNKVTAVLRGLKEVTDAIDGLVVPPFFLQRCRIHCLSQPGVGSSLELLAGKVANVKEPIEPFERPPSFFGVRFRFGPAVVDADGNEETHENFASVRFETYSEDPSQVWMEVAATYLFVPVPATLEDTAHVMEHIQESYEFLTERCKAFLDQFDERDEQAGEDSKEE